jgi:hypothetical protein
MKKLTLLFVAAALLSGGAYAQDKACCKKGGKCTKSCTKDAKAKSAKSTTVSKTEPAKKTS